MHTLALLSNGGCRLFEIFKFLTDKSPINNIIDTNGGYGGTDKLCQKADILVFDFYQDYFMDEQIFCLVKDCIFLGKALGFKKPIIVCAKNSAKKIVGSALVSMKNNKEPIEIIYYKDYEDYIYQLRQKIKELQLI